MTSLDVLERRSRLRKWEHRADHGPEIALLYHLAKVRQVSCLI